MNSKKQLSKSHRIGPRLRVYLGIENHMGPGKADLLTHIAQAGSIVAAGKAMKMSYRRAWLLVDAMNKMFKTPLVAASKGGKGGGGGATLTPLGEEVLARYRNMEKCTTAAIAADLAALRRHVAR